MTTPSLPQHDDAQRQAARAAELAAAQTTYGWAHQHTYDRPGQSPLVLEPIAILAVDKDHPFPANQNPTFVQVVEIGTTLLALIGNIIVSLTNLRDVGAVALDEPTSNSTSESKGLLGKSASSARASCMRASACSTWPATRSSSVPTPAKGSRRCSPSSASTTNAAKR